uniref:SMC5-SMC6 complex localization factor 1 n=1 Tax=Nothobranchius furzeri TaxID=105023 RepID=A0A8C6PDN4_NOTFU
MITFPSSRDFVRRFFSLLSPVDLPPAVLVELVASIRSSRLKLVVADAVFRNLCCRNGFTVGDEPHSLKKMVHVYLFYTLLLQFCKLTPTVCLLETENRKQKQILHTLISLLSSAPSLSFWVCLSIVRVLVEGETLLHRACIRNQVEAVLQILAHPDTDINVKDHAGWTPLHEACNHGSTECVKALLHHRPAPVLTDQVEGVSPLHDALLNGHMDIAKMLLEHAGDDTQLYTHLFIHLCSASDQVLQIHPHHPASPPASLAASQLQGSFQDPGSGL